MNVKEEVFAIISDSDRSFSAPINAIIPTANSVFMTKMEFGIQGIHF